MTLDDGQAGRQPQPRALAGRLGGEKRLKDLFNDRRRHAEPGVLDPHQHVGARLGLEVEADVVGIQLQVLGRQGDRAASGHSVAGIDAEVEQHLVQLGGVALHRPEPRRRQAAHLDALEEGFTGNLLDFAQQAADGNRQALAVDAARK